MDNFDAQTEANKIETALKSNKDIGEELSNLTPGQLNQVMEQYNKDASADHQLPQASITKDHIEFKGEVTGDIKYDRVHGLGGFDPLNMDHGGQGHFEQDKNTKRENDERPLNAEESAARAKLEDMAKKGLGGYPMGVEGPMHDALKGLTPEEARRVAESFKDPLAGISYDKNTGKVVFGAMFGHGGTEVYPELKKC